jgi:hypothetical protein
LIHVNRAGAGSTRCEEISMRQFTFALLCGASLLCAACGKSPEANVEANAGVEPPLYTIVAGPVTGDRATGINGTFRITQAADGIPSDLLAGACMIFRAQDLGYSAMPGSCHADSECKAPGAAGYCSADHTCWARPAVAPDPMCRRSLETHQPWPVDTDNKIAASGSVPVPSGLKPNAKAVVVACLRGAGSPGASDASPASTLCGQPQSLVKWGNPTTIP